MDWVEEKDRVIKALQAEKLTVSAATEWQIDGQWRELVVVVTNDAPFSVFEPVPTYWSLKDRIETVMQGLKVGIYSLALVYRYDDGWMEKGLVKFESPVWRIEIYVGPVGG